MCSSISSNSLSSPLIWRTIRIRTPETLHRFKSSESRHALIGNGLHVRERVHKRLRDRLTAESDLTVKNCLPGIRVLDLSVTMTPQIAKYLLDNIPESIQQIVLEQAHNSVDDTDIATNLPPRSEPRRPKHHHALESFHLSSDFQAQIEYVLLPFLITCNTNLKDFRGPRLKCLCIQSIHYILLPLAST
ncbi:hypothetical protein BGZ82_006007 [Podila clonocystis]|nr:hypothetical protein BGZ82_006007 [Podila clonocystis]